MMVDFQTFMAISKLYSDYATTVDAEDWNGWAEYFVDDCEYKVQPRENFERGFPLSTMWFISKGMLKDRAYGIAETLFHDPYYQRHVVGAPSILKVGNGVIEAQANYAVFRTKLNGDSTVFNVGRYIDQIVQTEDGLKFKSRFCIYDSEMIANSLIYPI